MKRLLRVIIPAPVGGIAQLVERLVRNEKVRGSNPLTSTSPQISAPRSMTIIALVRHRDIGIQNAMNLGDGLWIQRRAMIAWRNELALRTVEMTAPIGDDAVAAFWGVTAPRSPTME